MEGGGCCSRPPDANHMESEREGERSASPSGGQSRADLIDPASHQVTSAVVFELERPIDLHGAQVVNHRLEFVA